MPTQINIEVCSKKLRGLLYHNFGILCVLFLIPVESARDRGKGHCLPAECAHWEALCVRGRRVSNGR